MEEMEEGTWDIGDLERSESVVEWG